MSDEQDIVAEATASLRTLYSGYRRLATSVQAAQGAGRLQGNNDNRALAEGARDLTRFSPGARSASEALGGPANAQVLADANRSVRTGQGPDLDSAQKVQDLTQAGLSRPGSRSTGPSAGAGERPRTPGQSNTGPHRDRGGRGGR